MTIEFRGLPEFQRALKQISVRATRQVLRPAAAAGARVVRGAVKELAPVGRYAGKKRGGGQVTPPGVLRRSALLKFARERSSETRATYIVTFRRGKKAQAQNRDAFYWPWVEFGHRIVPRRGKGGAGIAQRRRAAAGGGRVPPHPFFVPGVTRSVGAAVAAMRQRMAQELNKVLK